MPATLNHPEYSTSVGLLLYTHRARVGRMREEQGLKAKLKSLFVGA
jgi:cell division protein FtsA